MDCAADGLVVSVQMNLATVAVLHTAMAMEDPFDNQGLDGIYVDEALFEAEQVSISLVPSHSLLSKCRAARSCVHHACCTTNRTTKST